MTLLRRLIARLPAADRSFVVYSGGTIVAAAITFYLVKYVIGYLSKDEYGLWGWSQAVSAMLLPVVSLSLPQAMMRMWFDDRSDDPARHAPLVTTTLLLNLAGVALLLLAAGALHFLAPRDYVLVAYIAGVTTAQVVLSFNTYLARVRNDYWLFAFDRVLEALGLLVLAAWAAAVAGSGAPAAGNLERVLWLTGAYGALLWAINLVNLAYFTGQGLLRLRIRLLPWARIRALVAFSAPLSGTYFLGWALASSDIWMLRKLSTLAETADYVFAVGIASVVSLVTQSALTDWPRFYYAHMRDARPDRDEAIAGRVRLFLWLHVSAILAVRLVARFAYELLGAGAYTAGLEYINYLILGNFFFLAGNLFAAGVGLAKRTELNVIAFAAPAALNVGLNAWLIPLWGARAAALTTLLAYVVFAVLCFFLGRPFYRFTDVRGILVASAAASAVALLPLL